MKISISEEAARQIKRKMDGKEMILKLKYETDGCGCAVSGVPTLHLIHKQDLNKEDMLIKTDTIDIYIEKSKTIFFDEEMKIDYSQESQIFRLTSPGQILNGRMSCNVVSG
ncbi:iron-sulfur cluster biosynthesis family protein [Bacillus sp. FJAT-49711]|uniref:iron-sulfur cluster biosynthesis family protein n=1 Tax=Bacillus sp. FJAT-49711 TaxID=2833585 RepID=UPI001BC98C48|nr:iron-sulfur cluster biosynthesis family protein [Bacillus sp. FJAT-49711]MBS4217235.1 iron-sulfur cluster biosynthesis family protein [Bacillus sp. FJAT-49711]